MVLCVRGMVREEGTRGLIVHVGAIAIHQGEVHIFVKREEGGGAWQPSAFTRLYLNGVTCHVHECDQLKGHHFI